MKKSVKLVSSILLFGFFIFLGFGSDEESDISGASSFEGAKKEVDDVISAYEEEYNDLCGSARNGQNKEKFRDLSLKISSLRNCGMECRNLDTKDQFKVSEYAEQKINSNKDFVALLKYTVNCW